VLLMLYVNIWFQNMAYSFWIYFLERSPWFDLFLVNNLLALEMKQAGSVKVLHRDVDSKVLRWETPKGYDDQSDSDSCANVVQVQRHCLQLICTFKR